jgi:hypothetical protein
MQVNGYEIQPLASLREANLREADLREANLRGADLRGADLREASLRGASLRGADLRGADLRETNLRAADLRGADLQGADLRGAKLDFSCWPLWCGSKDVKLDQKQIDQLCLHLYWVLPDKKSQMARYIRALALRAAKKRYIEL